MGAYQYIPPDSPIIRGTFSPYAQGFTGYYGEPSDPRRYPVNPGNPLSPDQPLRFTGVNGRQNCPGMIGPLDGMYYCTDKAFGYCDRRSGACFCGGGYTGLDCSACRPTHYISYTGERLGTLVYRKRDVLMIALVVVSATLKRESASVSLGVLGMIVPCRFVTNMIHYVSSATTRNVFVAKRVTM